MPMQRMQLLQGILHTTASLVSCPTNVTARQGHAVACTHCSDQSKQLLLTMKLMACAGRMQSVAGRKHAATECCPQWWSILCILITLLHGQCSTRTHAVCFTSCHTALLTLPPGWLATHTAELTLCCNIYWALSNRVCCCQYASCLLTM